ncbi:hypothetical protein ACMSI6_15500 [Pseudomonas antarctica]|uniref:hypothetical protein n=1 Tax=Pseudomonas antarctica TaxID=219572 RepID=UPI0039C39DD7
MQGVITANVAVVNPVKAANRSHIMVSVSTERVSLLKYQNLARRIFAEHSNVMGFKTLVTLERVKVGWTYPLVEKLLLKPVPFFHLACHPR